MKLVRLLGASALATSMLSVTTAWAQVAPADQPAPEKAAPAASATSPAAEIAQDPTPAADDRGEVIVTGTRIRGVAGKLDQAVPVTTITAAELLGARGDVSLGDALNQLPQLRSTFSQANSTGSIGTAGLNLLDLRGLGVARTLTLVNGRRVVTAVPGSYTPDVNTIPSDLVERVDIVTGGNSAIYGSDAIAGVVNFVLRRDFEGLRLRGQAGISTYHDRPSQLLAGIAGHNFADGKINVTASAEYAHTDPLFYRDRSYLGADTGTPAFITSQITTAPNRNFDGIPNARFNAGPPGSKFGTIALGGSVNTSCPALNAAGTNRTQITSVCTGATNPTGGRLAYNYIFQPNGTLLRDDPSQGLIDNRPIGGGYIGGLSASGVEDAMLDPGLNRISGNILINANFSDVFKPFIEASYTHVEALQQNTQPTFISSTLSPTFSVNNPFLTPQARATLTNILAPGATTFLMQRFNNDFGDRSENHKRDTYRLVVGAAGDISPWGNLHYDAAVNYGRTDNFYVAGGNVLLSAYNKAVNAVLAPAGYTGANFILNSQGQKVVCSVNAGATIADPACYPLNVFGYQQPDQKALNYILYPSTRQQRAQEVDVTAYVSGDTSGFLNLPGGPIALVLGGEYRRESALSVYDQVTTATPALTFLNSSAPFEPPAVNIKEVFGEAQVPLLRDFFLAKELSANGSFRVSDYGGATGSVTAWAAGGVWQPVSDFAVKFTFSRSVRAPNLTNLYATAAQTFANGFTDPCDQVGGTNTTNNITSNPNRARNCAAAGIPTQINYTDSAGVATSRPWTNTPTSGLAGVNQGNAGLTPEIGYTFSATSVFKPHWVPGFSFETTYYNIRVKNVIQGLTGQAIINRCYDDPVSIDNPFCAAIGRRTAPDAISNLTFNGQSGRVLDNLPNQSFGLAGNGISFLNQPFNFAALSTRGVDFDANYRHQFDFGLGLSLRVNASYVITRRSYAYVSDPGRYDRISGTGGDPQWQGGIFGNFTFRDFDLSYNGRYVGKQIVSGLSYDTFFSLQNRPPLNPEARPFYFYDAIWYHNLRAGVNIAKAFRFYAGVDNLTNEKPPYELSGSESYAASYPNTGRFYYAGFEAKF